jgi:hypothetical protein
MAAPYAHISPTAKLVAECRRSTDLPFAARIADAIGARDTVRAGLDGADLSPGVRLWMAMLAEARYKSLQRAIERSGCDQVLELAAGFAFRGAAMASPALRYVETDLPAVHAERERLAAELELPVNPQLVFAAADATSRADLDRVAARLAARPVAIVCEGLFQYLTLDEKRASATAIGALLDRFGGAWWTPDLETLDDSLFAHWTDPQFPAVGAFIAQTSRRDLAGSAFSSRAHVIDCFGALGFTATPQPQLDGSFALSPGARGAATDAQVAALRASRMLWHLTRA